MDLLIRKNVPSGIILALKRLRGIGKILTKPDVTDYNPGSVSRSFKKFLERNKLPHIRLHDLRHFNGTMMLRYGITEREASARLGHSNLLMTKKYQHVLEDMDKESADKLNCIFKPSIDNALKLKEIR
ncbi:tyrosine-type recombinase/integrase [Desulforamulus reducens]|uniref:tyrosine-type recombinase/integrase n=1 Tax=Desulforamulus reducens TaxID=59610 RepID=UPI0018DD3F0F|nr:tyrosine-type recombinase/integrase [Desulforamulus reducens]